MKLRPVGTQSIHADRRTGNENMTKLIGAFRDFREQAHKQIRMQR